jgi:hypothetical protein
MTCLGRARSGRIKTRKGRREETREEGGVNCNKSSDNTRTWFHP